MLNPTHPRLTKYSTVGTCSLESPCEYEPPCTPRRTGSRAVGRGTRVVLLYAGRMMSTVKFTMVQFVCEKFAPNGVMLTDVNGKLANRNAIAINVSRYTISNLNAALTCAVEPLCIHSSTFGKVDCVDRIMMHSWRRSN